jgi:hypothetical protein
MEKISILVGSLLAWTSSSPYGPPPGEWQLVSVCPAARGDLADMEYIVTYGSTARCRHWLPNNICAEETSKVKNKKPLADYIFTLLPAEVQTAAWCYHLATPRGELASMDYFFTQQAAALKMAACCCLPGGSARGAS